MNPFRTLGENFEHERLRWPLWMPVFIGLGIIGYFIVPDEPSRFYLAATPFLTIVLWMGRRIFALRLALAALLLIALGFNAAQIETWEAMAPMLDREIGPAPVTGILTMTEMMPDGVRLTLSHPSFDRLPPERTPQAIRIRMKDLSLADIPPTGSMLRLMAQVGSYSEPVMPDAYNFRRQSFFQELGGTGWSRSKIEMIEATPEHSMTEKFHMMFERMRRAITQHAYNFLKGDTAAMTAALLNGKQNSISKPVIEDMRASGLSHLLSISGVHVSMMGLLVYFPLRAILALIPFIALRFSIKKWAAGMSIIATIAYTFLVGSQAPTLRSALSTSILMLAIMVDRRATSMRLLALAASVVMILQPDGVMGPSFQMSFAAVLCMVAFYEKALDATLAQGNSLSLPAWIHFIKHHASSLIITSLIATAATTPFTIYHFQTFSFYGVAANMLAVPLTSFWIMPCILLTYLTAPFGWDKVFIIGAGWGVDVIIAIAHYVSAWPLALLHLPAMPAWSLLCIVGGGLWLCLWRARWRYWGIIGIVVGSLYPLITPVPDFMITHDGKEWAARLDDGRLAISNLDREKFVVDQWQQRLGFPELVDTDELPADTTQIRCDALGCTYRKNDTIIAMPTTDAAVLDDCDHADIIATTAIVRSCDAKIVIDDFALWQHGAHALYFDKETVRVTSVRPHRGARPWSAGWRIHQQPAE